MKLQFGVASLALFLGSSVVASAATLELGINGEAEVNTSSIDFGQYPTGDGYVPYPGYGTFEVSLANPGVFASAGVTTGEFGMIQSLSAAADPVGVQLNPTPGTTLPFITFDGGGSNLQLYLTEVVPGSSGGPFTFIDTPDGAVAIFNTDGFIYDTLTSGRQNFTGTFSATFNGETVSELLSSLPQDSPFSATFSASLVPEPSTFLLLGLGVTSLGLLGRRSLRSK